MAKLWNFIGMTIFKAIILADNLDKNNNYNMGTGNLICRAAAIARGLSYFLSNLLL
jgi:hypothetical protein